VHPRQTQHSIPRRLCPQSLRSGLADGYSWPLPSPATWYWKRTQRARWQSLRAPANERRRDPGIVFLLKTCYMLAPGVSGPTHSLPWLIFARMKAASIIPLAALAAGVLGQTGNVVFEDSDFNVTEALIDIGFNVSAIPELADLVERSSLTACSIAVSLLCFHAPPGSLLESCRILTVASVHFIEYRLWKRKGTLGKLSTLQCVHGCILVSATSSSQSPLCLQALKGVGGVGIGVDLSPYPMSLRREIRWSHLICWRFEHRRRYHSFDGEHECDHGLR
jgi:hypothetical protein